MKIHSYQSGDNGINANAYAVETEHGVVAIDSTLTVSDSKAFKALIEQTGKPLLAVLITHAHPDHVAGIGTLVAGTTDVPVVAVHTIQNEMERTEDAKLKQWQPVFGEEWIVGWTYPNTFVNDGETVTFDGVTFTVLDTGTGGDCNANSVWVIEDEHVAFIGDLVFSGTHSYIADGSVLKWLANLERMKRELAGMKMLYPGHGDAGDLGILEAQQKYLIAYAESVSAVLGNKTELTDDDKKALATRMEVYRPNAPLTFMVELSADAVAHELQAHEHPIKS